VLKRKSFGDELRRLSKKENEEKKKSCGYKCRERSHRAEENWKKSACWLRRSPVPVRSALARGDALPARAMADSTLCS
jgi:hypothetical protein